VGSAVTEGNGEEGNAIPRELNQPRQYLYRAWWSVYRWFASAPPRETSMLLYPRTLLSWRGDHASLSLVMGCDTQEVAGRVMCCRLVLTENWQLSEQSAFEETVLLHPPPIDQGTGLPKPSAANREVQGQRNPTVQDEPEAARRPSEPPNARSR